MRKTSLILSVLMLSACGSPYGALKPVAKKAVENVACANSQSRLYDVLYSSLVDLQKVPTETELRHVFEEALDEHKELRLNKNQFLELAGEFYQILLKVNANNPKDMLERLTALEVGDQTTEEAARTQAALKQFQEKWDQFASQQEVSCPQPQQEINTKSLSGGDLVYGARKVIATAYQSCSASERPPMTKSTPDALGITKVGTHPDGVGSKRQITDLAALMRTDYYLQKFTPAANCSDVRKNPLIYDYGGKPYTTSDPDSSLDLFRNMGSGTSVLGVDCSGYVFSAIASAGLKLDPAKKMKAIFVHGIGARMYMDPQSNGMPCFEKVSMGVSGTLKAGDVTAVPGHVVIIESVGRDPLGIAKVSSIDQCDALTIDKFDFVIAQSSPSKNGIGINKYFAPDYLSETEKLALGFEKYARDACRAKFQNKNVLMKASNFQVVRHKLTPACMDQPIALVGESCVKSCSSLVSNAKLNSSQVRIE